MAARIDATTSKALVDYHRRVLSKLAAAGTEDDAESELDDPFTREAAPGTA